MNPSNNIRLTVTKAVLWTILGVATAVIAVRFWKGLGATTALTDATPWGMWIGFDVLAGVALAAGGFVLAAAVYIFRLEKYHVIIRPAILTAFLGYIAVVMGLLVDLGRPWNIWRMIVHWQTDSPLFEVGWCVMLYSTVLALEFAPVVFEGLELEKPRRILRRLTLVFVIAGIGLSTLHQSSLGTLFLLARDRIHPLWDSPLQPLLFLVSAVALGLAMVSTESMATSWLYRRETEWPLLRGLTRAAAVALGVYLALRLGDLAWRGQLRHIVEGSWASALFLVELLLSSVIPILLFSLPSTRTSKRAVATGALLAVAGFILHRADVGGITHIPVTGDAYLPALTELIASLGVVSGIALVFLFCLERFPVWEEKVSLPDHFTPPVQDPVTRTYFGGPWFGRLHIHALGWICGVVLGVIVLELTVTGAGAPRHHPVRPARQMLAQRPEMLIDGDRMGTFVRFAHQDHARRLGGDDSCGICHHRNLPLDRATGCTECHADMYRVTDTYDHEQHVTALDGNRSCERCHLDPSAPKTRAGSLACAECHAADTSENSRIRASLDLPRGVAPGYRAAMHGLCVQCHAEHETEQAVQEPHLSRCAACHRGHSPGGEEMRVREGWTLARNRNRQ